VQPGLDLLYSLFGKQPLSSLQKLCIVKGEMNIHF
jgi:hypothetical protein